jgi:hypothetical protein
MAQEGRHPYPHKCRGIPQFKTRHDADTFIGQYQEDGHIKKCAHLDIGTTSSGYIDGQDFMPVCHKQSFQREREKPIYAHSQPMYLFHGCPSDCSQYESALKGKVSTWVQDQRHATRQDVIGFGSWFASLGWPHFAFFLTVLIVLSLFGISLADKILQALHEWCFWCQPGANQP